MTTPATEIMAQPESLTSRLHRGGTRHPRSSRGEALSAVGAKRPSMTSSSVSPASRPRTVMEPVHGLTFVGGRSPSNRSEAVVLSHGFEEMLSAHKHDWQQQLHDHDAVFSELVRQVGLHVWEVSLNDEFMRQVIPIFTLTTAVAGRRLRFDSYCTLDVARRHLYVYENDILQKSHGSIPDFSAGDTLRVHVRIKEGERERIQVFEGVCIARNGGGLNESYTVRKISFGEGVERVFPLHAPTVSGIEVVRRGRVRRAKLYYLRGLRGKAARIVEKRSTR